MDVDHHDFVVFTNAILFSMFLSKFVDSSERFDAGVVLSSLLTPLLVILLLG